MNLLIIFVVFIFLTSCSSTNDKLNIFVNLPKNIVKIENKHAIFLSPKSFIIKKEIKSEDCESWKLNYNFQKLYNNSLKNLLDSMFDDIIFIDKDLSSEKVENTNFTSFINFKENIFLLEFYTVRNTGKLKVSLISNFVVEGSNKIVKNTIKSEQSWEKNVYFNCNLVDGVSKVSSKAFENLMNQAHEKIYSSVKNIVR
tara:strand:+ start:457 stop:1053 length:597 start_codon:yes stop_codon:yes gene_type:complete